MTWQTTDGDRVLLGKELELYALGMQQCLLKLEQNDDESLELGIAPFDRLVPTQQKAALLYVFNAMTDPTIDPPDLTAVIEAIAYSPFAMLRNKIEEEIENDADDRDSRYYWRTKVLETYQFLYKEDAVGNSGDDEDVEFTIFDTDMDEWESLIDQISNAISDDMDWQILDHLRKPEAEGRDLQSLKEAIGVSPNFTDAPFWQFLETDLETVEQRLVDALDEVLPAD